MGSLSDFLSNRRDNPSPLLPWVIETCPAERYLDPIQPWTEVERWPRRRLAFDSLSAPSFGWTPTLVVRVTHGAVTVFLGAFGAEGIVPLGCRSAAAIAHPWWSELKVASLPWPEAWRTSDSAEAMVDAARDLIPKRRMILALCVCAREALPLATVSAARFLGTIKTAEGWIREEVSLETVREIAQGIFPAEDEPERDILYAGGGILFAILSSTEYFRWSMNYIGGALRPEAPWGPVQARLADVLRHAVPFREIVEGLVQGEVASR